MGVIWWETRGHVPPPLFPVRGTHYQMSPPPLFIFLDEKTEYSRHTVPECKPYA